MADKKQVKSFLYGALTGAVTGAVAALLLAPKPGRELRRDIADTAGRAYDKTAEMSRQAGSAVSSAAKKTAAWASDARQAAGRFVTELRGRKDAAESSPAAPSDQPDEDTVAQ